MCLRELFILVSTSPLATAGWISGGKKTGHLLSFANTDVLTMAQLEE